MKNKTLGMLILVSYFVVFIEVLVRYGEGLSMIAGLAALIFTIWGSIRLIKSEK